MNDRRHPEVIPLEVSGRRATDVLQTSLGIPVVLTLIGIVVAGLASYYGGQLAVQKSFAELTERITKVEASTAIVADLKAKTETTSADITSLKVGMAVLLNDQGYNADKILSSSK